MRPRNLNDSPASQRSIEQFVPEADVRETHEVLVRAPAELVFQVAESFDLLSIPAIYAIFWLRARFLGAPLPTRGDLQGLVDAMQRLGWGELARRLGREVVMGAEVQPWLPAPIFKPIAPELFRDHFEPDHVKIVWTLEAEPLGDAFTRFRTETRVQPLDEEARRKFRKYWRFAKFGIISIRLLLLPALRREAERQARRADQHG